MKKLTVVDGLDGSGKSTQLERLRQHFIRLEQPVRFISFPDYTHASSALVKMYLKGDFGKNPGDVNAYAASSFYAVDRYASYQTTWRDDYERGVPIIAARYTTSNAIHQMSKLRDADWDDYLEWLSDYEYNRLGLPVPDLVVFLDMPTDVSICMVEKRCETDGQKDIHEKDIPYLRNCRKAALHAAARWKWQVVDCAAGGLPLPEEQITDAILRVWETP